MKTMPPGAPVTALALLLAAPVGHAQAPASPTGMTAAGSSAPTSRARS